MSWCGGKESVGLIDSMWLGVFPFDVHLRAAHPLDRWFTHPPSKNRLIWRLIDLIIHWLLDLPIDLFAIPTDLTSRFSPLLLFWSGSTTDHRSHTTLLLFLNTHYTVQSCELNALLPTRSTPNQTRRKFAVALHVSGHHVYSMKVYSMEVCSMEVGSNQSINQTCIHIITLVVDHNQAKLFPVEEDTKGRGEVEDFFMSLYWFFKI